MAFCVGFFFFVFLFSVVWQEGLQGDTDEAWWAVQEELWDIH